MRKVIRCGICGLGRIGWGFHLPAVKNCEGMEAVAVADPLQERLDEAEKTYNVPNRFSDWKEMADPGLIDLAVIASPTAFHREQCEFFLKRGIDVFCDKPMALTLEEARSMAQTAKECGRKLMIYQPHRLTALAVKAAEIIKSGKLGEIYQIRRSVYSFVRRNDWQSFTAQGGGMLNNYGAHFLDQLLFLGGENKAVALHCETARLLSGGDAEDFVSVVMRGEKNILYRLEINMAAACSVPDIEIYGTRGSAVYQNGAWTVKYCGNCPHLKCTPLLPHLTAVIRPVKRILRKKRFSILKYLPLSGTHTAGIFTTALQRRWSLLKTPLRSCGFCRNAVSLPPGSGNKSF